MRIAVRPAALSSRTPHVPISIFPSPRRASSSWIRIRYPIFTTLGVLKSISRRGLTRRLRSVRIVGAEAAGLPSLAASRSARDCRHNLHGKYDNLFFRIPMPASPTAFLTVGLPNRAAIRGFRVPRRSHEWFRFRLFTGSILSVLPQYLRSRPATFPFLGKAYQCLWPFGNDDVYRRFRFLNLAIQSSAPSASTLAEALRSHDFSVACAGLHCLGGFTRGRYQSRMHR